MVVDEVSEVLRLTSSNISEAPTIVSGENSEFIQGIAKEGDQMIILLNVKGLLSVEGEIAALSRTG